MYFGTKYLGTETKKTEYFKSASFWEIWCILAVRKLLSSRQEELGGEESQWFQLRSWSKNVPWKGHLLRPSDGNTRGSLALIGPWSQGTGEVINDYSYRDKPVPERKNDDDITTVNVKGWVALDVFVDRQDHILVLCWIHTDFWIWERFLVGVN